VRNEFQYELERASIPDELKLYFEARTVAAMHYERNHDACTMWSVKAHERLGDALALTPGLVFYLDGKFDPLDNDFESLPRAFKRPSLKKFLSQRKSL
jgi:hypothetical protein